MKIKKMAKMKSNPYKSATLFAAGLLLTATLSAQPVTKEYHKQYTAGPNTTLNLSNKYGDVKIETSDQNQVTIDVKITVELPNRDKAEKLLSYINVDFSENENTISAKTDIDQNFKFTGWGTSSRRFSIDYNVKMPKRINLALSNRYGDSDLEEVDGQVDLDIKYGNLTATALTRGNEKPLNHLSLAYGKGSIESAEWLDVVVRYSGSLEIERSQALLIDSRYSKLQLGETSSVVGESRYDNIRIDQINNLVLDAGYSDVNIETLNKKLKFDGGYGALTVGEVPAGFESLETNTKYIGVRLGIDSDASYNLDAKLSYGDLRFNEDNFQNQKRIVQNNSSETTGIVGTESNTTSMVKIVSSYGTVKLN
jgi:hypothetical protein